MRKTTDFQLFHSMLIVPSLLHQQSNSERIFEKWCVGDEEEAKEVWHLCKTMLVHSNIMNICPFSTQFFTRNQATPDVCTEQNELKKISTFTTVWPLHLSPQKFVLHLTRNIITWFSVSLSCITHDKLLALSY